MVRGCTISIDNTALLEALAKTLEELFSNKSSVKFNRSLAESVINGVSVTESKLVDTTQVISENFQQLNDLQKEAVCKSLSESILYLWGPPGTGKTKTLGVCIESLVNLNKKVLICSIQITAPPHRPGVLPPPLRSAVHRRRGMHLRAANDSREPRGDPAATLGAARHVRDCALETGRSKNCVLTVSTR